LNNYQSMNRIILSFTLLLSVNYGIVSAQSVSDGEQDTAFGLFMRGASINEAFAYEKKCGFPFLSEVRANWDRLSDVQQIEFEQQFGRPVSDTSVVSTKGYFRLHYDTRLGSVHRPSLIDTGGNGIPDYVDSVAAIFDHVYEFHTRELGYDTPEQYGSADSVTGEIIRYDVYIRSLRNLNIYGFTAPYGERIDGEDEIIPRYKTYIVIDNSYEGYPTSGLDGLKVTAAHEFHHAIQLGAYGDWRSSAADRPALFFYEITSTWLEDVVYPDVNDYRHYLPSLFLRRIYTIPFYESRGLQMYARAIWGFMMERRYNRDIMRRKWEYIRQVHPLDAIDLALRDYGSTFEQELAEFNLWKFYTGTRARPEHYFPEGAHYPMLTEKTPIVQHMGETMIRDPEVATQTLHYHAIITEQQDTVYFIVCNVEGRVASEGIFYELTVFSQHNPGTVSIGNGLWFRLESNNPSAWKVFPMFEETPVADRNVVVYPNPFRTGQVSTISFIVENNNEVDLSIFSSDMRLVFNGSMYPVRAFDKNIIRWSGEDNMGRLVASGIYIYILQFEDSISKGKITLIRE
jgi:hypothetical protein